MIYDRAALWITAFGVIVVIASARTRSMLREGLSMALGLWTAAGLLRLCDGPSPSRIVVAAAVVVVRHVVSASLGRAERPVSAEKA